MTDHVAIDQLRHFHTNPRNGDVEAIAESIKEFGQFRPIVVNHGTETGRPNEVLAGNHVLMAMRALGKETVEVDWVDVDDETASKIVLIDNRSTDLSSYDGDALADLIRTVSDLAGTGYQAPEEAATAAPTAIPREAPTQVKPSGGQGHDQYDEYDNYKASDSRHLFLEWQVTEYEQVWADLEAVRKARELGTTGEVIKELIA
jgi:hypothetical protein